MTTPDRPNPDETVTRPPDKEPPGGDAGGTRSFSASGTEPPQGERTIDEGTTHTRTDAGGQPVAQPIGQFGKYELLDAFPGGMGVVYKAFDTKLNRIVALKVLPKGPRTRTRDHDRFWREARTVARLKHEYIIPIHDFEELDGQPYFTTDFIEGGNLTQNTEKFRRDPRRTVEFMEKVARAVHFAHENNVLHRDLKPGNILVTERGDPLIGDFGLAKLLDQDATATVEGSVLGTPAYMSPESALGRLDQVGIRSDVWSLGVVLYELLSGDRPFPGHDRDTVTPKIIHDAPAPLRPRAPGVDAVLEAIVLHCLEKNPGARYASAGALADDLRAWLNQQRVKAWDERRRRSRRRFLLAGMGGLGALAAGGTGFYLYNRNRPSGDTLKDLQRELARVGTVNLLGPDGRPRWYEWLTPTEPFVDVTEPGVCSFRTESYTLLELMRDAGQDHFRFYAEIRRDKGENCALGIYVGRTASRRGRVHGLVWLGLNGTFMGPEVVLFDSGQTWRSAHQRLDDGEMVDATRWHALIMDVSASGIGCFHENRPFGGGTQWDLIRKYGSITGAIQDLDGFKPDFGPHSGIGIFAQRCQASIRNVRVERMRH